VEAAFEVIGYLSDVRDVEILIILVVVLCELEINFLGEKELKEEVH